MLSPRNAAKAKALEQEFETVRIATDNQAVVDACDCVLLAVLPGQAKQVCEPLQFREGQLVISLMAGVPLSDIEKWCGPAECALACPLPAIAENAGTTIVTPPEPRTVAVFEKLAEKHRLFDGMDGKDAARFREVVRGMVLATDMARHGALMERIKQKLAEPAWHPLQTPEGVDLVLQIALKCADISNQARPWRVALAGAAAVVLGRVRVRRFDELRAAARRVADPAVDGRRAEAPGPRAHAQAQHAVGRARLADDAQRRAVRQLGDFLRVERDAGADDAALLRADLGVAVDDVAVLHEVAPPAPFGDRRRHRERHRRRERERRRLGLEGGHALSLIHI